MYRFVLWWWCNIYTTQLLKLHLPLKNDNAVNRESCQFVNKLAALPTAADRIQLTSIQLEEWCSSATDEPCTAATPLSVNCEQINTLLWKCKQPMLVLLEGPQQRAKPIHEGELGLRPGPSRWTSLRRQSGEQQSSLTPRRSAKLWENSFQWERNCAA